MTKVSTDTLSICDPRHPCTLMRRLGTLHYEIALLEEGRSLMADAACACARKCAAVIERIEKLRDERPPAEDPSPESLSLLEELREIKKKMADTAVEGTWLEMQAAGKKFTLLMVQQQHIVLSI